MPSQESDVSSNWDPVLLAPELKRAKFSGSLSASSEGSIPTSHSFDISWNSHHIVKAGIILESNSCGNVTFQDEEEMRRVFALLYDVYRYKHILNEALMETRFFQKHPEHSKTPTLVWLLFYDLHKRRFLPREHAEAVMCAEAFSRIGLTSIERDLWHSKVKLAASLARNRIKNNALRLNQLLPSHLRDERLVSTDESPMTGWINTFKLSKKEVCSKIEKFGLKLQSKHETVLTKSDFRFDHLCPKLLLCHPIQRADLAQSELVKNHTVVLQDRAFCIGPAIIAKILSEVPLRGTVAQSHVNSPRTTAYLANILADNDRLDKMIAFGAGDKLLEYQTYLHDLGVNNCEIYAQKFTEIHPEAAVLENLVAIFATPPNSCTAVTDPVDLICSRGGDMYMLKALTQNEMAGDGCGFLDEQKETLEYCMSLPQVQIILYETHSMSIEENLNMVTNMINKMNEFVKEKHEEDHRIMLEQEAVEEKMNKPIGIPGMSREKEKEPQELQEAAPAVKELEIPPCDLFELVPLPDLCSHGSECMTDEGCYLARIQRKEIISLDAKYMIKIAEARGLFGTELGPKKSSTTKTPKKREDLTRQRSSSGKLKNRRIKVEIERLTAPTLSSIHRTRREASSISGLVDCPRHHFHTVESANKVDVFGPRSGCGGMRRKSSSLPDLTVIRNGKKDGSSGGTKKCQDESMRRLSRPNRRWSTSPSNLLNEVRPSFWRYATAKSVEDLMRSLRKKRRAKRSFRADDLFILRSEKVIQQQQSQQTLANENEIPGLQINCIGKKYLYPFRKPYISNKWTNSQPISIYKDYLEELIFVLEEKEYGPQSEADKTPEGTTGSQIITKNELSPTKSTSNLVAQVKSELLRQCFHSAEEVFKTIENAIKEEEEKIKPQIVRQRMAHPVKNRKPLPKRDTQKILKYVQKIKQMDDEVTHIIKPRKSKDNKDIILHEKYLPGQQTTNEDKQFIRRLRSKLVRLQSEFPGAHWTKKKEKISASRLSTTKTVTERR